MELAQTPEEPVPRSEFRGTDRYQLQALLGAGAMGVVYQAFDRERATLVALKCLPSSRPEQVARFKDEFRALQGLQHENLVELGELVHDCGQLFFTMELVDGVDLVSYCCGKEGPSRGAPGPMQSPWRPEDATVDHDVPPLLSRGSGRVSQEHAAADERRVRSTFAQLARALTMLHGLNKVHCDVKPSNALVTRAGRLVLLDFGVVMDLDAPKRNRGLTGTVPYMSPEQAARETPGPESDWYSVGVMLFEVLTGRLPHEGSREEVLRQKQCTDAPAVSQLTPTVDPGLARLCARLLHRDPARRPCAQEILHFLERARLASAPASTESPFVGRECELSALRRALAAARIGQSSVVHLQGPSGTGKTTLLRKFAEQVQAEDTLVLRGSCSEREYVPYQAVDRAIDSLAAFIGSAEPKVRAELSPHLAALLHAFPAFGRLPDCRIAETEREPKDPHVRRFRLFRAMRALIASISARKRIVLILDDMQWADADSLALLSALVRPPNVPALLLIVASRPQWHGRSLLRSWGAESISVDNLSGPDARSLAAQLLGESAMSNAQGKELARRIASDANGHPLFISELVRHGRLAAAPEAGTTLLDTALWSRVSELGPQGRALIKVAALAGSALPFRLLATAAGLRSFDAPISFAELAALRNGHLLQFSGSANSSEVETYHDRIAVAVRSRLSSEEKRAIHRALAEALEADEGREPEELAVHWQGAGALARAAAHALTAAARASEALAFDRAARLYQMAIDCWPEYPAAVCVREQLGSALANAGRGAAAARAYLAASERVAGLRRFDLERRAADQLFRAGHVDEAEPLIARVLRQMGTTLPSSTLGTLCFLLLGRIRLALTRFGDGRLTPLPSDDGQLAMLDACWSVAVGLSMVDNVRGACMQSRHLLLALQVGEPLRLVRALASEASYIAVRGEHTRGRVDKILARADALASQLNDPYAFAFTSLSRSMSCFLRGAWALSREQARAAELVFETRPAGAMWELASARTFGLWSNFYLGDLAAMGAPVADFIQEAETRGDRYAATLHRTGLVAMVWLAADEPAEARQQVFQAELGWSRATFDFQRYLSTLGNCLIDLYEGAPELAYRRITEIWPKLRRSQHLRVQNIRCEAHYIRGIAAIASAASVGSPNAYLRDAERSARSIRREGVSWGNALASLLQGGIADVRGFPCVASAHWEAAQKGASNLEMSLFAAAAAFRRATAIGGQAGRDALRTLRAGPCLSKIREADRMCGLLAPGLRL